MSFNRDQKVAVAYCFIQWKRKSSVSHGISERPILTLVAGKVFLKSVASDGIMNSCSIFFSFFFSSGLRVASEAFVVSSRG